MVGIFYLKRVQKRENIRADKNVKKFLTKLFFILQTRKVTLSRHVLKVVGGKARMKCRVETTLQDGMRMIRWKEILILRS